MCGRFAQQRPSAELAVLFGAEALVDDPGGHFNVAPTQDALVVAERDGERRLTAWRWGLVPHWAPGIGGTSVGAAAGSVGGTAVGGAARSSRGSGSRAFNARSETAPTSPLFRAAFERRRCLVPVDAFYEWRREAGRRVPYAIGRRDGLPLALAGLWSTWRDPASGEPTRSFAILTTGPNAQMAPLHDRMPVVIAEDAWARWLDTRGPDPGELRGLLVPCADDLLEAWPVGRAVNDVRNDGPDLLRPVGDAAAGDAPSAPEHEGLGLI